MADQGTDANFIPASFLEQSETDLTYLKAEELSFSLTYHKVTWNPFLPCAQPFFIDDFL